MAIPPRALCATLLLAAGVAQATELGLKPGLWATATRVVLNDTPVPTVFDGTHPAGAAHRAELAAVMKQFGLPAGWQPGMACQKTASYALPALDPLKGCTAQVTAQGQHEGLLQVVCEGQTTAKGSGTVSVTAGDTATTRLSVQGQAQGKPLKLEVHTEAKWLGPRCDQAPQGIDPSWLPS